MSQGRSRRTPPPTHGDAAHEPPAVPITFDQAVDIKSVPGDPVGRATLHARLRLICALGNTSSIARATGIHPESVRRYVAGDAPSLRFVSNLIEALSLSADWLLCGRGQTMLWPHAGRGASSKAPAQELELIRARLSEPLVRFPIPEAPGRDDAK